MGTCATGLVTRGYICCNFSQDQILSYDKPRAVLSLEVRPKLEWAAAPPFVSPGAPKPITAQELRPKASAKVPAPPSPAVHPVPVTATELRPKVTKAEEE